MRAGTAGSVKQTVRGYNPTRSPPPRVRIGKLPPRSWPRRTRISPTPSAGSSSGAARTRPPSATSPQPTKGTGDRMATVEGTTRAARPGWAAARDLSERRAPAGASRWSRRPRCRCRPAARNTRSRVPASFSQAGPQFGKADGRLPASRADETPERGVSLADYRFPVAALDADQDGRGLPMPCDHDTVGLGVVDALPWALLKASNAHCLHNMSSVLRPGACRRTARTYTIRSASATS